MEEEEEEGRHLHLEAIALLDQAILGHLLDRRLHLTELQMEFTPIAPTKTLQQPIIRTSRMERLTSHFTLTTSLVTTITQEVITRARSC